METGPTTILHESTGERITLRNAIENVSSKTVLVLSIVVFLFYAIVLIIPMARNQFDPSIYIVAGDRFVSYSTPIRVLKNSDGYDGEFYYRLAVAPFSRATEAAGVRFDSPPWRMQRIVYPLIVYAASFGNPTLVPACLLLVNVFGLAFVWILARKLTKLLRLPEITPLAVLLWPGFLITLTHDTTEIISAALLLSAIYSHFRRWAFAFTIVAVLALLCRETNVAVVCGLVTLEILRRRWVQVLVAAAPLIPFFLWRAFITDYWGYSPSADAIGNLQLPFVGLFQALAGYRHPLSILTAVLIVATAAFGVYAAALTMRRKTLADWDLLAMWAPVFVIMSLLSSSGPWIDATASLRASTEFYMISVLLIGSQVRLPNYLQIGTAMLTFVVGLRAILL